MPPKSECDSKMLNKRILVWAALAATVGLLTGCGGTVPPAVRPTDATGADSTAISTQETWTTADTEAEPVTTAQSTEPAPESTSEVATTEQVSTAAPETQETGPGENDPIWDRVAQMSLEDRVAQLLIVTPEALAGVDGPVTMAGETTKAAFDRCPVGGILYMGQNLEDRVQVENLCWNMQQISLERTGLPAFLCVDEEGGTVARISGSGKFDIPAFENMAEVRDADRAKEIGRAIGVYLSELGFNVDFAPDADVLTNPANTVVRSRSFGADPEAVRRFAAAYAEGLKSQGILACYKHFPGHGATAEDSHLGYAVSNRTREELLASELVPFRDAAEQGIPFIMVGHITTPKVTEDGLPASLSRELVTDLLRGELGYDGIVITDALSMGAISQNYKPEEAAVLALQAGNDMLLLSDHLTPSYTAVLEAVRSGKISEEQINQSVYRVLKLKLARLP